MKQKNLKKKSTSGFRQRDYRPGRGGTPFYFLFLFCTPILQSPIITRKNQNDHQEKPGGGGGGPPRSRGALDGSWTRLGSILELWKSLGGVLVTPVWLAERSWRPLGALLEASKPNKKYRERLLAGPRGISREVSAKNKV